MSAPAAAPNRRAFLPYALGFDLVVVAAGLALLFAPDSGMVLVPFIGAIGIAASRGGAVVGFTTTAFSVVALVLTFARTVTTTQLMLLAFAGAAVSALLDTRATFGGAVAPDAAAAARDAERELHGIATNVRTRVVALMMEIGLPALVAIVYLNLSPIIVEQLGAPSLLQPLILVMGGLVLLCHENFRPGAVFTKPLAVAVAAYCLVAFVSSNWARDSEVADGDLVDLVKSIMLLLLTATIAVSWRSLRRTAIALVIAAAFLSLLTVIQVAVGDPSLQFGGFAKIDQGHLFGEVQELRPAGPVGDANYLARILLLAFPLAAFLGVGRTDRREQAAWIAAAALIAAAILFTYSRGGMLTLAAIGGFMVLLGRVRITPAKIALGFVLFLALLPTNVGRRLLTLESLFTRDSALSVVDASAAKRAQLLNVGWAAFMDHPILGVGYANFGANYSPYANQIGLSSLDFTPMGVRQYAHNLYLEIAVETGLLGVITFAGSMLIAVVTMYRARQSLLARGRPEQAALVTAIALGLIGYLISSIFLHSGWHRYLWMFLGLAIAAVRLADEEVAV